MTEKILVVGGAGYIGSHCVKELARRGYDVVTLDNLSRGHRHAVKWGAFEHGDMADPPFLRQLFGRHDIAAVMHFAALTYVGESVTDPHTYYKNNVCNTLNLLGAMREAGVRRFIFSSTCATYGEPQEVPITESHPQSPINPYGQSKLMVERILADYARAYEFQCTSFRYFNAAGADPDGEIGEEHDPESHLIPLVLRAAQGGPPLQLFGTDYPTPDGTCVRDYIHVTDLAAAHILGLERLLAGHSGAVYNLGNGNGYSNLAVIRAAEATTGRKVAYDAAPRRPGDPATLVGSARKAVEELGWKPRYATIEQIMQTAWGWHSRHPAGAITV
ncbi:MAG: UDP-glucose 4-epimerase GalE [Candidatus Sericytochromatia bacterium]|nr:UDP-glucose 4-epimerase GalE [Candidatus Tanganyikabacteria bacterium]